MKLHDQAKTVAVLLRAIAIAAPAFGLSGCFSVDGTSFQPQPLAEVAASPAPVSTTAVPTGPVNTGRYPTFGGPLTAANVQMENTDAAKIEARMTALSAARRSGSVTEAEYQRRLAELRRLASEHGAATEAEISN
ncbi:hypothetical protein [Rhizobium sp. RU36D]|uniref:hypothetical protein n=1 Tax=Rhizobium sp. RU36D TaxID=1907415 RepID=UPI0009D7AC9D|nr:hypothetical protein [Rhizobium sp. RU36D]SMC65110.1 hypothetical protein SAMN05880593_10482 [Rhizobium sp. RU36D]